MNLEKLIETYDMLYSNLSAVLKEHGYDQAIIDELSLGTIGKMDYNIDEVYLPFVEYIVKKKRYYDGGFTAKNLLKLLQSKQNAFCLTYGLEAPLALISIYLIDGTLSKAEYYFARDNQEAEDDGMCDIGYKIGIGYLNGKFATVKTMLQNNRTYRTTWKENHSQSANADSSSNSDFVIDCFVLKKYKGQQSNVVIPKGVQAIEKDAFSGCGTVSSIVFPATVISIGEGAFRACTALESITIPHGVRIIRKNAFDNCTLLKNVTLPNTVTSIGSAFNNCPSLKEITIPDSVCDIVGNPVMGATTLLRINVDENNETYKSIEGNLYTKDGKTLLLYTKGKEETSFVVPDGVQCIAHSAFAGCTNLESVIISDDVTTIENSAFHDCPKLMEVIIGKSVATIGMSAFSKCMSLKNVKLSPSVETIAAMAFSKCPSLTNILIPSAVKYIQAGAFWGCSALTIYCEREKQPLGFDTSWNNSRRPVVWGYKG